MGFVYFFKQDNSDVVKIGMTKNNESVISRFNAFKTHAPYGATNLGVIETTDPAELEKRLHNKYKAKRINGEFYKLSPEEIKNEIKNNSIDVEFYDKYKSLSLYKRKEMLSYLNRLLNRDDELENNKSTPYAREIIIEIMSIHNENNYYYAAPVDLKNALFENNNKITKSIIKKVLINDLSLTPLPFQRYCPLNRVGTSKVGRPYKIPKL